MKGLLQDSQRLASRILPIFIAFLLIGCATQRTIWAGRVGIYTYDQAVIELGPPDKQARLADGTQVADWLTQRSRPYSRVILSGGYSPSYGPVYSSYGDIYSPDYYLRLTFGADGKLQTWKEFAR